MVLVVVGSSPTVHTALKIGWLLKHIRFFLDLRDLSLLFQNQSNEFLTQRVSGKFEKEGIS